MATLKTSERVAERLREIVKSMGGGSVQIGFMEGATYPDGTPVAAVAFWNEFGVPSHNQPPRPFFREMISEESGSWPEKMAMLAKSTNYDGPKVLALMGEDIEGALKQSITDFTDPNNAPVTIKAKGFDKPLVDTGHMLNSTAYRVMK